MSSLLDRPSSRSLRDELRGQPGLRFVDADLFQRLASSRGDYERADVRTAGLRGLRDRRNGTLYLIEEERLR